MNIVCVCESGTCFLFELHIEEGGETPRLVRYEDKFFVESNEDSQGRPLYLESVPVTVASPTLI